MYIVTGYTKVCLAHFTYIGVFDIQETITIHKKLSYLSWVMEGCHVQTCLSSLESINFMCSEISSIVILAREMYSTVISYMTCNFKVTFNYYQLGMCNAPSWILHNTIYTLTNFQTFTKIWSNAHDYILISAHGKYSQALNFAILASTINIAKMCPLRRLVRIR